MTTNLSKHSMKSTGYVKWVEALVVVTVEYWPNSSRPRSKAHGHDPTMLWLGRAEGFQGF